jgi:hypothetical protein
MVMSVIVRVIAAADVDSFTVHRSVVESDSVAVAITVFDTWLIAVVETSLIAVLIAESDPKGIVTYPMT